MGPEADLYPMGSKRGSLQGPEWLQSTSNVMQGNSRTAQQVPRRLWKMKLNRHMKRERSSGSMLGYILTSSRLQNRPDVTVMVDWALREKNPFQALKGRRSKHKSLGAGIAQWLERRTRD